MAGSAFSLVTTPGAAVEALIAQHKQATNALRTALERYLKHREVPEPQVRAQFYYPELRVTYSPEGVPRSTRRAYAKFPRAGVFSTTITQPEYYRDYLLQQLRPLVGEYGAKLEVGRSTQEIPFPYVIEKGDELSGGVTSAELARFFPVPNLAVVGDEVADGIYTMTPEGPWPLSLFDAARVDYSLKRLVHYTGSHWEHCQPFILLTNYHRYVDQFVRWGVEEIQKAGSRFTHMVLPGNRIIDKPITPDEIADMLDTAAWSKFQMPAYHLVGEGGGITLVNIGVGPSNAKNITDHLAVLRPHVFLMIGHCGGLRMSQEIGDYVLAHAYLREDNILDALVPPSIPIPALAEVQVALQEAARIVTGESGDALKARLRTGTVVTYDDRNWELRWSQERKRINLSRAIAVDMESGTIAANGYRLRVPYGTLLCVSDKPLHGEIKLPGAANAFYERAVGQHLQIGLKAVDLLRDKLDQLHTRKLRSFDEPAFR